MNYQEILDILDEMEQKVQQNIPLIEGFVVKSFVIEDVIGGAREKVKEAQKAKQERIDEVVKRLKQMEEEADQAEPLKTRTYTKLEDLAIGDTVKACLTTGTRIPTYLEQMAMTIIRFTRNGNAVCDLGDGGKPFSIPPYMLLKIDEHGRLIKNDED